MLKKIVSTVIIWSVSSYSFAHTNVEHREERIKLSMLGSFKSGSYNQGAAEIVSYDPVTHRAFVTNAENHSVDAISLIKPSSPKLAFSINLKSYGSPNSVAVSNGLVAVAVQAEPKQNPGSIVVFDTNGEHLNTFEAGALPDMVSFTPDGKTILAANEGEPNDDYSVDPQGSITLIEISDDITKQTQRSVRTASFADFKRKKLDPKIRIFGKNASVAQDLEPEYITVSDDSKTAWVSLQENNALAEIDIATSKVTRLIGLGTVSHNTAETAIDASDKDQDINIRPWPVNGMYQPDTIANYIASGQRYIVTANEGDARDYQGFSEEVRVAEMELDNRLIASTPNLQAKQSLGRLKVSSIGADSDNNGKIDTLYSFGTRSFSIWHEDGTRVFDSGSEFAQILARDYPALFDANDKRNDDKGAEPEALAIGQVGNSIYAFIGLERAGGIMVYNITNPAKAFHVDYFTTISSSLEANDPNSGDRAPESIFFVSENDSPIGKPFIITANEISSTVSIYAIDIAESKRH